MYKTVAILICDGNTFVKKIWKQTSDTFKGDIAKV